MGSSLPLVVAEGITPWSAIEEKWMFAAQAPASGGSSELVMVWLKRKGTRDKNKRLGPAVYNELLMNLSTRTKMASAQLNENHSPDQKTFGF